MKDVLILYPKLFCCQSKFDRKVTAILSKSENFSITYLDDPNGYIRSLFASDKRVSALKHAKAFSDIAVSHAIVFSDSEEFLSEIKWFKENKIPLRWVKIPITRVINIKNEPKYQKLKSSAFYEYIGRGSYWGNPYSMYEEGESREEVIRKFKYDFDFDKFPKIKKEQVHKLAGKRLGCFCKPLLCHGDVLADYLNSYDDGK